MQNIFQAFTIQFDAFAIRNMSIRNTFKHSKMSNKWFSATLCLFWSFILDCKRWTSVENMYCPVDSLGPKGFENSSTGEQTLNQVHDHAIFPFCHSILLMSVIRGEVTMYLISCTKLNELTWCEFPASRKIEANEWKKNNN